MPTRTTLLLAALAALGGCGGGSAPAPPDPAAVAAIDRTPLSGPYSVGLAYRRDPGGRPPGAMIFYPAGASSPLASDPPPGLSGDAIRRRFGAVAAATLDRASGPIRPGAGVRPGRYPLILFMPGAGLGARDYRLLLADLASNGRVVVALYPASSPGAGEERYRAAAAELAAAARAIPSELGDLVEGPPLLLGHSLGGAAAILALASAPSAAGAVNIDGDFAPGLAAPAPGKPLLYVTGSEAADPARTRARRAADWAAVAGSNPLARRIAFPEMRHLDSTDAASLAPALVSEARDEGRIGALGGAEVRRRLVGLILARPGATVTQ